MCKCPMLKQVDAEIYGQMRGTPNMPSNKIPNFGSLDIDYGNNCTKVTITCNYPRFTRHRSSVYYTNGANFSTVRRYDLADKYSIRCNQITGVWLSDENSEITYIQCAYRPMLVNKVVTGIWEEFVRFCEMVVKVIRTNFGFAKFIVGYD
ncbi:hypothetical protein GCK72_018819 [Caenorhabditis remanei]|uniref:Uncharacterized protein n=1 Tax=Caenorhabditis remanei TaxID=31234 RepID=A0A6A5GCC7_CAERE|nr:hypothetical protein GCK72_018819 [Caenorhabditis remanei]KAF1752265.1 hypothetical protein GCK72_018819 [Caenorhabditis remanei]